MPLQTTRVVVAHQKCFEPKLLVRDGRVILLLRVTLDHLHGVKREVVEGGSPPSAHPFLTPPNPPGKMKSTENQHQKKGTW